MSNPTTLTLPDDRGVSELVGVVLLFGIVIAGSAMIFLSGSAVTDEVAAQSRVDSAESAFVEMDSSIQSLAQQRGSDRKSVDLGSVDPNKAEIRKSGQIRITINQNAACSATMNLSALEYHDDGGDVVVYEAGAIWKDTESGLATKKSPELGFRNGSLQLKVVSLQGAIEDEDMNIDYDREKSIEKTQDVQEALFSNHRCSRPKNVTLTITSDYHEGWQSHLESSLPENATVVPNGSNTVTARFSLDQQYKVVDFAGKDEVFDGSPYDLFQAGNAAPLLRNGPSPEPTTYRGTVTYLGGETARFTNDTVKVNETKKQAVEVEVNETVPVEMNGTVNVTVERNHWEWNNDTDEDEGQAALEVAFVLDESGSMDDYADYPETKLDKAQGATRSFLDVMSADQGHRVSVIGYDNCRNKENPWWRGPYCEEEAPDVTTYQSFTTDQSAASDSLDELDAFGGTPIPHAINQTSEQFRNDGTDDKKQIMVLLTDGQNTVDASPVEAARENIPDGVTVYTIGVGDDVNDDVLQQVADEGADGSKYIDVDDASELDDVFERIAENETESSDPNKEWDNSTVNVTVDAEEWGSENITVTKNVSANASYEVGDTVNVSVTRNASDNGTVTKSYSFENKTFGPDGTVTDSEPVTGTVDVPVSGENETTIEGSVVLGENRTKNVTRNESVPLVTSPTVSMALANDSGTVDLWGGANLNARGGSVEPGSYANFHVDGGSVNKFVPTFHSCSGYDRTNDTVADGGTNYTEATCSTYGSELNRSSNVHIYENGSVIDVADSAAWQTNLTEMLTVDGEQYYERTGGELVASNLDSNQLLVVVEADDAGSRDANNVVLLVEVGQSTSEASAEYLVNVEVTSVSAEEDDEDD